MAQMHFKVGDSAELKKAFSDQEVRAFSGLSLDTNPVHLEDSYAAKTFFKNRIVHGALVSSLVSAVLGTKLPGPGSIFMGLEMKFVKPVYIGDEVTARVEVEEIKQEKSIVLLKTSCLVGGAPVIEGKAVIKYMPV